MAGRRTSELCVYGDGQPATARGRCKACNKRLNRMTAAEREEELERLRSTSMPVREKFEWVGDENSLIEMTQKLERVSEK
jgi:hypothetical protein